MSKLKVISLLALSLMIIPGVTSCGETSTNTETSIVESSVLITTNFNEEGGSISYENKDYTIGDTIVLNIKINKGYSLAKFTINNKKIRVKEDVYLYTIDSQKVEIYGVFEKNNVVLSDFEFELDEVNKTAKIKKYSPDRNIIPYPFIIPETVVLNNNTYTIDGIKKEALISSSVEQIKLSKNIKDIELETFANVHGLQSILVDENNPYFASFNDCLYSKDFTSLIAVPCEHQDVEFTIKDGTKIIEKSSLMNTRIISKVVVPNSIQLIKDQAFMSMPSLITATLPNSIKEIPIRCFANDINLDHIVIPEGVSDIKDYAFNFCPELKSVTFPSSLKEIGVEAFYHCEKLDDVILNEGLQVIHKSAFGGAISLRSIEMPSTLKRLEDAAFETCQGLVNVTLNEGLEYLGGAVFILTSQIRTVEIPASVKEIHYNPFIGTGFGELKLNPNNLNFKMVDGVLYNNDLTKLICYPYNVAPENKEFVIPSSVTELGYNAFSMNIKLKKLTIPFSVEKMVCAFEEILPDQKSGLYELELFYEGTPAAFKNIDTGGYPFDYKANFKNNIVQCKGGFISLQGYTN